MRVLGVLKEGGMDVIGFLDALCWGNLPAVTDPVSKTLWKYYSYWLAGRVRSEAREAYLVRNDGLNDGGKEHQERIRKPN